MDHSLIDPLLKELADVFSDHVFPPDIYHTYHTQYRFDKAYKLATKTKSVSNFA